MKYISIKLVFRKRKSPFLPPTLNLYPPPPYLIPQQVIQIRFQKCSSPMLPAATLVSGHHQLCPDNYKRSELTALMPFLTLRQFPSKQPEESFISANPSCHPPAPGGSHCTYKNTWTYGHSLQDVLVPGYLPSCS